MKFTYVWSQKKSLDEVEVISHPTNKAALIKIEQCLDESHTITVKNVKNERVQKIEMNEIEAVFALGHVSKVLTISGKEYFLQKRLKELQSLESHKLFRINNSIILNLNNIESFVVGSHARLEVFTKTGNVYTVSRHYAKQLKERLS